MFFYIFMEIYLLFLLVILKSINITQSILNIFTLLPISLTLFFNWLNLKNKKENRYLYLVIFMAFLGDLSFSYYNDSLGILFFCFASIAYFMFLNKLRPKKIILIITFISFLSCIFFPTKFIFVEIIFYAILSLMNLLKSLKLVIRKKLNYSYFISFLYLAICDINLSLNYIFQYFKLNKFFIDIFFIVTWTFYLFFQIILTYKINTQKILKYS